MAKVDNDLFLRRAREAYDASTSYFDTNYRRKIENSLRHFSNRHHKGSKYYNDSYKYRSKGFRPKTRASVRANEAKAMAAFFSNRDVVSVEPMNTQDPAQVVSAALNKELLFYRLTHTIPWFQTCVAGVQDAQVTGAVCSYQHWTLKTTKDFDPLVDESGYQVYDDSGQPLFQEVDRIVEDKPVIELRPINNIRFSPSADWIDPINSSPYLIDILPMHIIDVEAKMREVNQKTGEPKWKKLTRSQMITATKNNNDTTDYERREGIEDPTEVNLSETLKDYYTVWVHRNFIKKGDTDYVFYTLGTEYLLTNPVPIEEIYWTGERPYAFGTAMIEAHKVLPDSIVHISSGLQQEANEIRNQRLDNVKLVLNKRYFARRGGQVDLRSLIKNVAGGVTLMNDPASDVVTVSTPDVTQSSYEEQNRVDADFDEISGAFSNSSVMANRQMSETVGGMSMLRANGNEMAEYLIRTVSVTWVETVMRQLLKLEQKYETDEVILSLCAEKAKVYQRYGTDADLDDILNQELTTSVNMGLDATDPMMKVNKLLFAVGKIKEIIQEPTPGLIVEEVAKEIFGSLGYKDGTRFFNPEQAPDPQAQQMQEQLEQTQAQMQKMKQLIDSMQLELVNRQKEIDAKVVIAEEDRQAKLVDAERSRQTELEKSELDRRAKLAELDAKSDDEMEKIRYQARSALERQKVDIAGNIAVASMRNNERPPDVVSVST
jgi:hypothetical protein